MKTDKFGRHELLDRSCLAMELVEDWLMEHGGLKEDEMELANAAHQNLFDLYQLLGKRTL